MGLPAPTVFRSRLGRRLLALFVASVLLPVTVLATLSLRSVSRHLREQTQNTMRQEAKSLAMSLLERLDLMQRELPDLELTATRSGSLPALASSFAAAGCTTGAGDEAALIGNGAAPVLSATAQRRLALGRPALLVVPQAGLPARVIMLVADGTGGRCWGEIRPEELWKRGATIPPRTELSVLTAQGLRVLASGLVPASVEADVAQRWAGESSGSFTWHDERGEYLATFWTIPMSGNYGTENWIVSLHEPLSSALAPIAAFRTDFDNVVILALLLVLLAGSALIRRTLTPLGNLLESTRRLASQNFVVELPSPNDDELGELSAAFSTMAAELERHFARLISTAHQLEEERARLAGLVEHSPYGVVLVDGEGRLQFANQLARHELEHLGIDPERLREIGGHSLDALAADADWRDVTVGDRAPRTFAVAVRRLGAGAAERLVVLRDVTVERQVQRQLQLQERLSSVGQLAAGMAHDLNNVLDGIGKCAELLEPEVSSDAAREDLATLRELLDRAASLIRQVLDFGRRSGGVPRNLDLGATVEQVVLLLQRTLPATIRLRFEVTAAGALVFFDSTKLHQVLTNLAVNARDAMPNGGELEVSVRLCAPPRGHDGEWVCLAVRDDGLGIPLELQAKVFDPFFTTKPVGEGTGLGLSQVYGIVAQHGGLVDLESQPGRGTTVRVLLPVATAATPGEAMIRVESPGAPGAQALP